MTIYLTFIKCAQNLFQNCTRMELKRLAKHLDT